MQATIGVQFNRSGAVALFEFFLAAAWARVVSSYVLQGIANGFLGRVAAVWAMDVCVLMFVVLMLMVVIAVRAVNVGFLVH
jgi:hypothetical protein